MQNHFFIETEVAHRRREWEREIAVANQRSQVPPETQLTRWSQWAALTFASLRSLATPRLPVPSWNPAGVKCAEPLEGGRATVM